MQQGARGVKCAFGDRKSCVAFVAVWQQKSSWKLRASRRRVIVLWGGSKLGGYGEVRGEFDDFVFGFGDEIGVLRVAGNGGDPASDLDEFFFAHAAVVAAGDPRRMPLVTSAGLGSKGIIFLLQWILAASSAFSTDLPLTSFLG